MGDVHLSQSALSALDIGALSQTFAEQGRVQVQPFLEPQLAQELHAHLATRADWRLALRAGGKALTYDAAQVAEMSTAQRAALARAAAPRTAGQFGYSFGSIGASGQYAAKEAASPLGAFAAFVASPAVLDAVRAICGAADIDSADAQATRYCAGDFLTVHHDQVPGVERRVAYVLGLTGGWRAEYGGLLMFHDERGDIASALVPRMNILTLFAVPQAHSVSVIAPFAPAPRYAVSGWFWAPTPPA